MPEFFLHLIGIGNSVSDLAAKQNAKTAPQPMQSDLRRIRSEVQPESVKLRIGFPREIAVQLLEQLLFALGFMFAPQPLQRRIHQRASPTAVKNHERLEICRGVFGIEFLRNATVPGDHLVRAAPLLRIAFFLLVPAEIVECGEQERPEFSLLAIKIFQGVLFEEMNEKTLGQILSVMRSFASPAHKRIKRKPIRAAEPLQRERDFRAIRAAGAENQAPLRSWKCAVLSAVGSIAF